MMSREALRERKRRIIWNNDGDDLNRPSNWNAPGAEWRNGRPYVSPLPRRLETVDDYLGQRIKGKLDGTQVDSIFCCGYTSVPNWEFPTENTHKIGPDPLKHVVDYAHANDMEFFYSFRMNDIHLSAHRASWLWSKFRMENLHLLQGKIDREWFETEFVPWMRGEVEEHPLSAMVEEGKSFLFPDREHITATDFRTWAAFDWGHKEVRDYYLSLVQEACRRYDLDGIEFDWSRTPPFFKTEHRTNAPVMTDFIHQVRQWLDQWGQERGKPVLLACLVPDSPSESLNRGLDARAWLREGLVDILAAGFAVNPFSYSIAEWTRLGHEYGVPVFGTISYGGRPGQGKKEIERAIAQRYWGAGVDGIYLYNHFFDERKKSPSGFPLSPEDILHDIGDPTRLRGLDKTYCVDTYWGAELPVRLSTESGRSKALIRFEVAADPAEATCVTLQTQWAADVDVSRVSFCLNGTPVIGGETFVMEDEKDDQGWYAYPVSSLNKGINRLEVTAQPSDTGVDKFLLKQVRASLSYDPAVGPAICAV